jgi:CO/xanthine dehydrogenase FAD-binding subunit
VLGCGTIEPARETLLKPLAYERPTTVEEAVAALSRGDARALAGGTDLIVQMREGRKSIGRIVDLKRIPELTNISQESDGGFRIGAAANFNAIAAHEALARAYPSVPASGRLVGSLQVQNRAGLGGNICNASPSADAVPVVISLDAHAEVAGLKGRRQEPIEALFEGPGRTTLAPGEILISIVMPPPKPRSASCYLRFTPRREMDIAIAGAGVAITIGADGAIADARITLAAVAPVPLRAPMAETALKGEKPSHALFSNAGRIAAGEAKPIGDTRGSADYRRELVAVLTQRALVACAQDLKLGITSQ